MSYTALLTVLGFLCLAGLGFHAIWLHYHRERGQDPRMTKVGKRLMEIEIQLADLHDLYERLMTSHKRLRSSAGMAKLRAVRLEEESTDLKRMSEAEILRSLNLNRRPS